MKRKKPDLKKHRHLNRAINSRTRSEVIDYDYLDKLSADELDWLNRFTGEYVSGAFKKLPDSVRGDGRYCEDNLHTTPEQRKESYKRNNDRNNDYISVGKAKGQAIYPVDIFETVDEATYAEINDFETLMQKKIDGEDVVWEEDKRGKSIKVKKT